MAYNHYDPYPVSVGGSIGASISVRGFRVGDYVKTNPDRKFLKQFDKGVIMEMKHSYIYVQWEGVTSPIAYNEYDLSHLGMSYKEPESQKLEVIYLEVKERPTF